MENIDYLKKKNQSKYEKKEKIYHTIRRKRKLMLQAKVLLYLIALLFSLILVCSFYSLSQALNEKYADKVSYTENGFSSFKVYLNNNTYYENSYLEGGMHYVASLINVVNIDYKYGIHADEKVMYKYGYDVVAKTVITEKNEPNNILFTKDDKIIKNKVLNIKDTNFVIDENIDIDYSKYNDYVNNYKKDYSLDIDANVIVTMKVNATGRIDGSRGEISKSNSFDIVIPLTKQTVDIFNSKPKVLSTGTLIITPENSSTIRAFSMIALMFAMISIYWSYKIVYIILTRKRGSSLYDITIKKYLKEYDRAIVETGMTDIDEDRFKQIVKISSFQELLDLHDNFKYPIFHYEVEEGIKSYFVVIKDDVLYKLTISQACLERKGIK